MGKKDVLTKIYLGQDDIFADAFNYFMFDGKPFIKPSDLKEQDTNELSAILKDGKLFANQKFRDVLKLCNIRRYGQTTLVLLGIEGQSYVNYTMPVRDYLYDALNYAAQIANISAAHEKKQDLKDSEKLSGFSNDDHILPVITLCICFDNNSWDRPRSLYDMFGEIPPEILKYVNNYKLNLISPEEIKDFKKFNSELGTLLKFIQISDNKKAMYDILESGEYENVGTRTVAMINEYTGAGISTKNAKGGHIDMGNAWKEIIEDKKSEARMEGADQLVTISKRLNNGETVESLISEGLNPAIIKKAEDLLLALCQ